MCYYNATEFIAAGKKPQNSSFKGRKKGYFEGQKGKCSGEPINAEQLKITSWQERTQRRLKETVGERGQGQSLMWQVGRILRRQVPGQGISSANNSKMKGLFNFISTYS